MFQLPGGKGTCTLHAKRIQLQVGYTGQCTAAGAGLVRPQTVDKAQAKLWSVYSLDSAVFWYSSIFVNFSLGLAAISEGKEGQIRGTCFFQQIFHKWLLPMFK